MRNLLSAPRHDHPRVERTLLSAAFDFALGFALDFAFDPARELRDTTPANTTVEERRLSAA